MAECESLPATAALEEANRRMLVTKEKQSAFDSKSSGLADKFYEMTFDDDHVDPFPAIEWDSDDDVSTDSERSLSDWNAFLSDCDSPSLGKRGRAQGRSLVRSKKIKSDLSSLANSFVSRSA